MTDHNLPSAESHGAADVFDNLEPSLTELIAGGYLKPVPVKGAGHLTAPRSGQKPTQGNASFHGLDRARERLDSQLSAQRQYDLLRRIRKGHALDLSRGRLDRGRWYVEDGRDRLVVVTNRSLTTIVTLWPLEPGSRTAAIVAARLAPARLEARHRAEEARLSERQRQEAAAAARDRAARAEIRDLMGEVRQPGSLKRRRHVDSPHVDSLRPESGLSCLAPEVGQSPENEKESAPIEGRTGKKARPGRPISGARPADSSAAQPHWADRVFGGDRAASLPPKIPAGKIRARYLPDDDVSR